jgi:hypothetical protein
MFPSFNVNSTTTLDPGQPASVQTFFDGASIRFNFGIPRGKAEVISDQWGRSVRWRERAGH